jgi:hypothetical protein
MRGGTVSFSLGHQAVVKKVGLARLFPFAPMSHGQGRAWRNGSTALSTLCMGAAELRVLQLVSLGYDCTVCEMSRDSPFHSPTVPNSTDKPDSADFSSAIATWWGFVWSYDKL